MTDKTKEVAEIFDRQQATIEAQAATIEKLEAQRDAAIQQAQVWKMEAQCHKSSLLQAYQFVTGGKGELGDWNGANPIIAALKETSDD